MFANDLLPTFHHSSLESSVTCTRSPGLEEIRPERRWKKRGGREGKVIEVERERGCGDESGVHDGEMKGFERGRAERWRERKESLAWALKITLSSCHSDRAAVVKMWTSLCVPLQSNWYQSHEVYMKYDPVAPTAAVKSGPDLQPTCAAC